MPELSDLKAGLLAMLGDAEIRATLRELFGLEEKEKEIRELKEEVAASKLVISQQEERLADLEQYSRRNCLNFTGVPESRDENTVQLAIDLAKMANVKLERADIDRAHRVGRPREAAPNQPAPSPRTLVVKYVSYLKREAVWFGRKQLRQAKPPRSSGLTDGATKEVFVQENLTRKNQEIMYLARQLKRAGKLWAVWSDGCVLKVKQSQQSATVRLRCKTDLRRFE
ncbi:hypothetical protein FJT64_006593 [Amphibalanus amphitrite]|uniref:Uncharacterized protein n=1 Tax=Amphibalanus amphitrite TaxID=1232801 RepID=A0A6A4VSE9_AMPAM|nr:hypothetical protein FJT64_006593 [Amphibalanus amphitrite]